MANGIVRLFGLNPTGSPYAQSLSEEELKAMIASSSEASVPDEKKMMLHNIFEIGSTQIREVMIPRGEVTAVDIGEEPAKILDIVIQTHYSRIPVYRGNFDNPIGILNVKDLPLRPEIEPGGQHPDPAAPRAFRPRQRPDRRRPAPVAVDAPAHGDRGG